MVTKFFTAVGIGFIIAIIVAGLAVIFSYPTMWVVNFLFNHKLLETVFGTERIGFWQAFCLNYFVGLFKTYQSK